MMILRPLFNQTQTSLDKWGKFNNIHMCMFTGVWKSGWNPCFSRLQSHGSFFKETLVTLRSSSNPTSWSNSSKQNLCGRAWLQRSPSFPSFKCATSFTVFPSRNGVNTFRNRVGNGCIEKSILACQTWHLFFPWTMVHWIQIWNVDLLWTIYPPYQLC